MRVTRVQVPRAAGQRRIHVLTLLSKAIPEGLPLRDLTGFQGRDDRATQAATMGALLRLRQRGFIECLPPPANQACRGRLYRITVAGTALLGELDHTAGNAADEALALVIETGAMRGERPTIILNSAARVRIRAARQPYGVFSLAQGRKWAGLS